MWYPRGSFELQVSVGLQMSPCTQRAKRDQRKRSNVPDRWVTVLKSKGTHIEGLLWAVTRSANLHHLPARILKIYRGFNQVQWFVLYRWSQHHTTINAVFLGKAAYSSGKINRVHITRIREGVSSFWLSASSSWVNQESCPFSTTSNWHQPQWIYYAVTMLFSFDN